MAGFGIMFSINVFMDSYLLSNFKDTYSARPFAEMISEKYKPDGEIYVTNNLKKYFNLYALNFYLHNNFKNIDLESPKEGYFVTLEKYSDSIRQEYGNTKDIWSWTGYLWEELMLETPDKLELLGLIDIVVDGRFELAKKDLTLQFRGSSNQRIIDVQKSLATEKVVLWNPAL